MLKATTAVARTSVLVAFLVVSVLGQSCSRYGGGSCCDDLTPINRDFQSDATPDQPFYVKFLPASDIARDVDNYCVTIFPLPDDPDTFLVYHSTVHCDGTNVVISFILSQSEPGVRRLGKALCSFTETVFGLVNHTNVDSACEVNLVYRCRLRGECTEDLTEDGVAPVYGFSNIRRPISRSCLNSAKATIRNNGLPGQDYYILPMRLPTRCVFNQVCTIQPVLQRFRQAVGIAFPAVIYL